MTKNKALTGLFLIIVLGAFFFRIIQLDLRPMHHDEANQAVKFGDLLEKGEYRYDKDDHHGPSLYYLTLPFVWIFSGTDFTSTNEFILRLVPVFFGLGLILLLWFLRDGLGLKAVVFAALFAAVSPALVYYNRFYIQETLLVFSIIGTIAAGWMYFQKRTSFYAGLTGMFAGLMYATKETCIIAFGALFGALVLSWLFKSNPLTDKEFTPSIKIFHLLWFCAAAVLVSFLFYSSFFKNINGLLDSVSAFGTYFSRADLAGWHTHPWDYYFKILTFSKFSFGPLSSEFLILLLALVGSVAAFFKREEKSNFVFTRFVLFFSLFATVIYSIIPYKTPWNLLPFYIGFVLLAGKGAEFLINISRRFFLRILIVAVIVFCFLNLGIQSYRINFKNYANPQNPYAYAQTSIDFLNLVERINEIVPYHAESKQILIKVITDPYETWPLPWYLRSFGRVGYWQDYIEAGDIADVPLLITSLDKTEDIQSILEKNYLSEFYELRPNVLLALHIQKDLWNRFLQNK